MSSDSSTIYPLRNHSSLRGDNAQPLAAPKTGLYRVTSANSLNSAQRCNSGIPVYNQYFQQSAYQQPFPFAPQQPFFGGFYPYQQQQQQFGFPQPYGYPQQQQQQQQPYGYYGSYGSQNNFPPITSVNPNPGSYPQGTIVNQGSGTYPQGTVTYPQGNQGSVTYPQGTVTYPQGSVTYPQGNQGSVTYPQGSVTYPQGNQGSVTYPQGSVVTTNPATKPTQVVAAPAPAPAPVTVPSSNLSTGITNPLNNSTQPTDNPLNWAMYSQDKSALYPSAPLDKPNTNFRSLAIGINNTGNDKFHLDNPIFDLMNFTEFFSYKACRIPFENAVVMAGCLRDRTFEPTATNIETQMKAIVAATNATKNGAFILWYSGHGTDAGGGHQDLVGEDVKLISDDDLLQILGQGLEPGHSGVIVLDACHSGGQNWPYVASASDDQEKPNSTENVNNVDLTQRGHTKLFLTSAADQTSADGLVGQGGAGSQALRYALVKYGMGITNQQVLDTTSSWLKAHGFTQVPSIQSSHPFQLSDPFFPQEMIGQMGQLERSVHGNARELQEHEDVRPSWQKPLILQAKIADQFKRIGHLDERKAKAELALSKLLTDQMGQLKV